MYKEDELKLCYNKKSGVKRKLGPNIYKNPFRMKAGNWEIVQEPNVSLTAQVPVSINIPSSEKPVMPTIPAGVDSDISVVSVDEFNETTVTIAHDSFAIADRSYTSAVLEQLETPTYEIPEVETPSPEPLETEQKQTETNNNKQTKNNKNKRK